MDDTHVLDQINGMSADVSLLREKCVKFRNLLDEGTYKIDSLTKIVSNLKAAEVNNSAAGGDQAVLQQMNEEQINSFLEMLKTPAFQNLARQLLLKLASAGPAAGPNTGPTAGAANE